jgi:hypothetical protein
MFSHAALKKNCGSFMDHIKKSVCDDVRTGLHYELIRLKIRYLNSLLYRTQVLR